MRIQFDFYHAQIVGGDLIRRFEKHLPLIGHVQIAAVPSRHEPDEGEVNYPAIFAAFDRLGYQDSSAPNTGRAGGPRMALPGRGPTADSARKLILPRLRCSQATQLN